MREHTTQATVSRARFGAGCDQGAAHKKALKPPEQRQAVQLLVARGLSERRACALVAANRATVQYHARPRLADGLPERLALLAQRHPRYGYRRVWALLRREGWQVNRKRVHRLWRVAHLKVLKRHRRRHHAGVSASGAPTHATHPGHVWTYDFVQDACLSGAKLKLLPVVDEFTRECLAIEVATSAPAARVIRVLERLFAVHVAPQCATVSAQR